MILRSFILWTSTALRLLPLLLELLASLLKTLQCAYFYISSSYPRNPATQGVNQVVQNKVLGYKSLMKAADNIKQAEINQLKTRKSE